MKTVCGNSPLCETDQKCCCEQWEEYQTVEKMIKGLISDPNEEMAVLEAIMNLVVPFIKKSKSL